MGSEKPLETFPASNGIKISEFKIIPPALRQEILSRYDGSICHGPSLPGCSPQKEQLGSFLRLAGAGTSRPPARVCLTQLPGFTPQGLPLTEAADVPIPDKVTSADTTHSAARNGKLGRSFWKLSTLGLEVWTRSTRGHEGRSGKRGSRRTSHPHGPSTCRCLVSLPGRGPSESGLLQKSSRTQSSSLCTEHHPVTRGALVTGRLCY